MAHSPLHSPAPDSTDHDLKQFFAPVSGERLSVSEKEELYRALRSKMPQKNDIPYKGSFLWGMLTGMFSSFAPVAAVIVVLVLTGAGYTYAKTALPGDFLYPLKRVSEKIETAIHFSSEQKLRSNELHIGNRLDEATELEKKGQLNEKTSAQLEQEYRLERRQALDHIQELEDAGNKPVADQAKARLNAAEDRYERLFRGTRRDIQQRAEDRENEQ